MNIVFIVTSFWSFGELLIAMEFADELVKSGDEICFIAPPTHKNTILKKGYICISLVPKSRQLNRILFNEVKYSFKPDLVILSDFLNYNFADRHYGITKEDLNIFDTTVCTFDNFYWNYPRKCMDTYGFKSDIPKKIVLEDYGARIVPCPIINSDSVEGENVYTYSLISDFVDISNLEKRKNRIKYGFDNDEDKIILVSYAKWQNEHIEDRGVSEFIKLSNSFFNKLIIKLAEEFHIICVGSKEKIQGDNIHYYSSVHTEIFDELVSISDIYISRNMTSTSMVRIALSGVRCVNIINSISDIRTIEKIVAKDEFNVTIEPYRYLMFPVGWYSFLKPIFDDNPYAELIIQIEQFEIERGIETIKDVLYEDNSNHIILTNKLRKRLSELMTPKEIVRSILSYDLEGKR